MRVTCPGKGLRTGSSNGFYDMPESRLRSGYASYHCSLSCGAHPRYKAVSVGANYRCQWTASRHSPRSENRYGWGTASYT